MQMHLQKWLMNLPQNIPLVIMVKIRYKYSPTFLTYSKFGYILKMENSDAETTC